MGCTRPLVVARRTPVPHRGLLGAYEDDARVGGAVIAYRTPEVHMLEGRPDRAVLWDLRSLLMLGGGALARPCVAESKSGPWRAVAKIETRNVNVAACRFYAHMGFMLGAINRHASPQLRDEAQLLWYRAL